MAERTLNERFIDLEDRMINVPSLIRYGTANELRFYIFDYAPRDELLVRREVKKLNKPLIGIHFDGRPISSDTADECLNAILECWNPAVYTAEAVTDALLGKLNPSGKMPLSTARCAGQIPVYYNHPNGSMWTQAPSIGFTDYVDCSHKPRYCFGHGLSYTSFEFSDLALDKKETKPFETVNISLKVKNTGKYAGTEIVQLYVKDIHASMTRPYKELQGFARVELQPSEEKTVAGFFLRGYSLAGFLPCYGKRLAGRQNPRFLRLR